ncbi:MAG: DUF6159 family protein [Thermoplasmatota archaeon]
MGRLSRSWDLTKASFRVLRQDKELLWMPVLSGLASIIAVLMITGVGAALHVVPAVTTATGQVQPLVVVLTLAVYIALAFVSLFFTSAVVAAATERLSGGTPTVGSALKAAWAKAGKILAWAVVVGIVNLLLQVLREAASRQRNALGQIASSIMISLGAAAWNLATTFMVPVLLFEDRPLAASFRSSAGLFKKTWGETVVANVGLGMAEVVCLFAVWIPGAFLLAELSGLGAVALILGALVLVAVTVAVVAVFSVLSGIYKAALYRFATTGQVPTGFAPEHVSGAFSAKAPAASVPRFA